MQNLKRRAKSLLGRAEQYLRMTYRIALPDKEWIHAHHVVKDSGKEYGSDDKEWKLSQLFADVIHIHSVHAIEMLPKEYRQFHTKHLK